MSTNPFRRSSLKDPGGSGNSNNRFVAGAPADITSTNVDATVPLSLNTKVPTSSEKHVNFASPPAIPISPVSYPPSPESTRWSPAIPFSRPILPSPTDYSGAIQSDPFRAEAGTDDDDIAIEQALENAKANTTLVTQNVHASKEDAVRNTLSRFASAPKKLTNTTTRNAGGPQISASHRQTMDVDAFKRLLLTGDSSGRLLRKPEDSISGTAATPVLTGDNSSGTDTASLSQKSFFDQGPAPDDSPRSSNDTDTAEADIIRRSLNPSDTFDNRKKPAPPTPRRGRPVQTEGLSEANINNPTSVTVDALSYQATTDTSSVHSSTMKKPPPPPSARRTSQSSNTPHVASSRNSSSSEIDLAAITNENNAKAPPVPRSRRPVSTVERRPSSDLPPTAEESDAGEPDAVSGRKTSGSRPPPPPTRNSGKRLSAAIMNPPPPPPPRRGRGSSRGSIDSQRPPASVITGSHSERASGEYTRPGAGDRKTSAGSNANDILADLAALQRELDEARGRSHQ